ncbi:hypothetical protein FQN55_005609 [Onygenales sp. PD_40]|nr:hypothetical protein FQN55_005609 [Onygenales sp. PD_40]
MFEESLNQSILKPWNITELELSLQFRDLHTNDNSDDNSNSIDLTSDEDDDSDDNNDLQSLTSNQSEHPDEDSDPLALTEPETREAGEDSQSGLISKHSTQTAQPDLKIILMNQTLKTSSTVAIMLMHSPIQF